MPRTEIVIVRDGKEQSLWAAAREAGISPRTALWRYRNGWPLQLALSASPRAQTITVDGVTRTIHEWSRELGVHGGTIRARLRRFGWDERRAVTTPVRQRRRKPKNARKAEESIEGTELVLDAGLLDAAILGN